MSTLISPLEQLEQQTQQPQTQQTGSAQSGLSPLEELEQQTQQSTPEQPGAPIQPVTTSTNPKLAAPSSAIGMPEYVGAVGTGAAGLMAGSAALAPEVATYMSHLDNIIKLAKNLGWASFGIKEAADVYKSAKGLVNRGSGK